MRHIRLNKLRLVAMAIVVSMLAAGPTFAQPPSRLSIPGLRPHPHFARPNLAVGCSAPVGVGFVHCNSKRRLDVSGTAALIVGYGPADLQKAYNASNPRGIIPVIGIVDAYDDPSAEADLQVYRAHFGLPTCSSTNGCFRKLNQRGRAGPYPYSDASWGGEISLDLDMVSAVCPLCHIVLVEGDDNSYLNLGTSVNTAVNAGAEVVNNSYGGGEYPSIRKYYDHPGHVIVASAGDTDYNGGVQSPADFSSVVAVGGTSLYKSSNTRGFIEWAWSGTNSGCSTVIPKPAWQHFQSCPMRMTNDISAVADGNTGVAVYDTFGIGGRWFVFQGTSISAPIIASLFAIAGNTSSQTAAKGIWDARGAGLKDIIFGSNGACSPAYFCTALPGYDGPTGWGVPNGLNVFK